MKTLEEVGEMTTAMVGELFPMSDLIRLAVLMTSQEDHCVATKSAIAEAAIAGSSCSALLAWTTVKLQKTLHVDATVEREREVV